MNTQKKEIKIKNLFKNDAKIICDNITEIT